MAARAKAKLTWGLALVLLVWAGTVSAGPEQGRAKAAQCAACHGIEGRSANPSFPRLAGQSATYLAVQLQKFRSGERHHPLMSPVASALSDEDIDDLAQYFSRIPLEE